MDAQRKQWLLDTLERLLATFIETFIGAISLSAAFDVSALKSAAIAGVAAGLSYLKSTFATLLPNTVSPSSMAPDPVSISQTPPAPTLLGTVSVGITDPQGKLVAVLKGDPPS